MSSASEFLMTSPNFRPFDLRFHTRMESPAYSLRSSSPSPSTAQSSRISSISMGLDDPFDSFPPDEQNKLPWEVVRWTKLRKLSSQVYSENGQNQFGAPTCIAVASTIAIGTAKGYILLFDYSQNLLCALGSNIKLAAAGCVTSVAFSHDHAYVASGHEHGHIYVWHIKRPVAPRIHISPIDTNKIDSGRHEGHVSTAKILHIGFMAKRHSVIVSADDKGMAFFHTSTQQIVSKQIRSIKLVGRYPTPTIQPPEANSQLRQRKATSVLAFAPMPLGNSPYPLESRGLVALMTPHILVIMSTSPTPHTQFTTGRPKSISDTMGLSGCLDWFPAVSAKAQKGSKRVPIPLTTNGIHPSNPRLAYCWSNVVTILDVSMTSENIRSSNASSRESSELNNSHHMEFTPIKKFTADEAIVALRWLNSQIIVLVTITQRLLILNEHTMHVTDTADLVPRQIMHHDYFSAQLNDLVISNTSEGGDHYATIPDAFFNSFKTFKGRIFLLGSYEFAVGHLSSWAERLESLMENEKFAEAIHLATRYYNGEAEQVTIGLPEDEIARHMAVHDRLITMVLQALRYTLNNSGRSTPTAGSNSTETPESPKRQEQAQADESAQYRQVSAIADASFEALYTLDALDVLFDSVYEYFENANLRGIYFETLEPYILAEKIISLPPAVVKELINIYASLALNDRLEEIICHLDTTTLDIDQVTMLCRTYELYDAMIYVWNQALGDYISPMSDFMRMIPKYFALAAEPQPENEANEKPTDDADSLDMHHETPLEKLRRNISKVYSYLSYIFTSRVYPTGLELDPDDEVSVKSSLYYFLFLGSIVTWPKEHGTQILVSEDEKENSRSFPYLRLLLKFDAPSFVATMNEAFEDTFLDGQDDDSDNESGPRHELPDEVIFAQSLTRQYIIDILLEILSGTEFTSKETIYLDMFIARSAAKYPQFIKLSDELLRQVMFRLCDPPSTEIADDCQLSVEYLLSAYRPEKIDDLVKTFVKVRYFRVLKWIFRSEKQYSRLISVYFEDAADGERQGVTYGSQDEVFTTINECLAPKSELSDEERTKFRQAISANYRNLVSTDPARASEVVEKYMPELRSSLYEQLADRHDLQFKYLKALFSPELRQMREGVQQLRRNRARWNTQQARETYVNLLCEYDKNKVIPFLRYLQKGDVRISKVLSSLETAGVIDGEIFLLRSEGQYVEAINRLTSHLDYLEKALLLLYPDPISRGRAITRGAPRKWVHVDEKKLEEVERALQHYVILGTRLCTERAKKTPMQQSQQQPIEAHSPSAGPVTSNGRLSDSELVWLDLIDSIVGLTRHVSTALFPDITAFERMSRSSSYDSPTKTILFLRRLVQDVFSALLAATSSTAAAKGISALGAGANVMSTSFLRVLEAFLTRTAAASPSVVDLRSVLANIFEAYIYERQLLTLTNRLLNKDLMVHVASVYTLRQEGWRVSSPTCEICSKRVWGTSVLQAGVYDAWDRKLSDNERKRQLRFKVTGALDSQTPILNDKPSAVAVTVATSPREEGLDLQPVIPVPINTVKAEIDSLVTFKCKHVYHRKCLEKYLDLDTRTADGFLLNEREVGDGYRCLICQEQEGRD
ncbi:Golgi CORVET complex core vacuolar protein 8-domain-containing protein [Limtongia smithiae]|uniref:Golgi CORVET complex core vacuolar protein 8-domain-containing protein n=1 Tax=Limtongia smithiae TaxID=1125753 RepID=UPI0034CEF2F7